MPANNSSSNSFVKNPFPSNLSKEVFHSCVRSPEVVAVLGVELSETLESSSSGQSELRVAPYTADNRIPDPIVLSRAKIPL